MRLLLEGRGRRFQPKADDPFGTLQVYSNIVQRCFDDCVTDFTTKSIIGRENGCINRCFEKFMKGSERVNQRFQEQNTAMMQSGGR